MPELTGPPARSSLLVTFIVSEEGEPLRPFTESIARVDLDQDGNPTSFNDLIERVRRAITRHRSAS